MTDPPRRNPNPITRPLYVVAGVVLTALGIIGAFVPVMPTTIFLILAAACFARSSPRLEAWLVNHPKWGPSIRAWRENGAIPRRIKFIAIGSMVISFAILAIVHMPTLWLSITGAVLLACALFVGTRPEGPKTSNQS